LSKKLDDLLSGQDKSRTEQQQFKDEALDRLQLLQKGVDANSRGVGASAEGIARLAYDWQRGLVFSGLQPDFVEMPRVLVAVMAVLRCSMPVPQEAQVADRMLD
jgi:hypothetical protein